MPNPNLPGFTADPKRHGTRTGTVIALDMTRSDLQGAMKQAGRPWEVAKAFEASAPATAE